MGEFNSDDHYINYCGPESLRRNGVAVIVNKRFQNAVVACSLKNDSMILVHFQGKSFSNTVMQVYVTTTNAEEAEVEWFYVLFMIGGLECKNRKSRDTWSNRQVWPQNLALEQKGKRT